MLFKQELAEKILAGDKTQTRRPVKAGEVLRVKESPFGGVVPVAVIKSLGSDRARTKIRVGGDYAVQYKYGQPCRLITSESRQMVSYAEALRYYAAVKSGEFISAPPGTKNVYVPMRIRVTDIRRENVLDISHADAVAEGFRSSRGFWEVWCGFYDKPALSQMDKSQCSEDWVEWVRENRPAEKYQAWAYTFELVV